MKEFTVLSRPQFHKLSYGFHLPNWNHCVRRGRRRYPCAFHRNPKRGVEEAPDSTPSAMHQRSRR